MILIIIVLLLVIGFILITMEALAPGFHIFGLTGLVLVIAGIGLAMFQSPLLGMATLVGSVGLFVVIIVVSIRSGAWKRLTLETEQRKEKGYRSDDVTLDRFVGKTGRVLHDLRPVGYAEVDGQRVEAVSESDFVRKGQEVKVIRLDGTRVVVRPTTEIQTDRESKE